MAQLFHDRRGREARTRMTPEQRKKTPAVDYLRPIVAVRRPFTFKLACSDGECLDRTPTPGTED